MAGDDNSSNHSNNLLESTNNNINHSLKTIIKPRSQLITVSLDDNNFLLWKFQIETAISGYGLEKFLDNNSEGPARIIADSNGDFIDNPEFVLHKRQDSLLASWLLSSISTNLLSQVIGCKTSLQIWTVIQDNFSSQSSARVMFHKKQLQETRKDGMSIRDYVSKIKNLCDLLDSAGHKVSETDQILTILNGLDQDFESVVAVISSDRSSPNLQHVVSILLAHEGRINQRSNTSQDFSINFAGNNFTGASRSKFQNFDNTHNPRFNGNNRGGFTNNFRGFNGRGRGRGRFGGNKPRCQLCERVGHTAKTCFSISKFCTNNNSVQQSSPGSVYSSGITSPGRFYSPGNNSSRSGSYTPNIQYSEISHDQSSIGSDHHHVNQAESSRNDDFNSDDWYPDSGATNHVTNNLSNLNLGATSYQGRLMMKEQKDQKM